MQIRGGQVCKSPCCMHGSSYWNFCHYKLRQIWFQHQIFFATPRQYFFSQISCCACQFFMETLNSTNGSDLCEFSPGSPLSKWTTVFLAVFLMLSLAASLFLNGSFTIIVLTHKALHQKEMVLNLVLTISNICSCAISYTPSIASVINGAWPFGKSFCYVIGTIALFLTLLRFTFILAITVDRFGAVMYPFQYPKHSTKITAVIFTVGSLYGAVASLVFDANDVGCYNLDRFDNLCTFRDCHETWCYFYISIQAVIVFSFGIVHGAIDT